MPQKPSSPNSDTGNHWGNAQYTVLDSTAVPAGTTPEQTTTPASVSIGDGSDTPVLKMAENPYQGDGQFTVSVDGNQIGGTADHDSRGGKGPDPGIRCAR